jgi:hypothetical protein
MTVVVVAGGLGDLGRLITDAIVETEKYEVYVMTRKVDFNHLDHLRNSLTYDCKRYRMRSKKEHRH